MEEPRHHLEDTAAESHEEHDDHDAHVGHDVSFKFLALIGVALLVLTWMTVAVMNIDLGREGNVFLAMAIAAVKASLVALFFMHLFWDRAFNGIVFVTSVAAVALFIALAMTDSFEYRSLQNQYRLVELQGGDATKVQEQLTATEEEVQKVLEA